MGYGAVDEVAFESAAGSESHVAGYLVGALVAGEVADSEGDELDVCVSGDC